MASNFPDKDRRGDDKNKPGASNPFNKLPPQDLDAERGVLGSILLFNDVIDDVADVITANHFYLDAHQLIYKAIFTLHDN